MHSFPGNVRELESLISDAVAQAKMGRTIPDTLRSRLHLPSDFDAKKAAPVDLQFGATLPTLKVAEDMLIKEALRRTSGNKSLAAVLLGTTRQTLTNKLRAERALLAGQAPDCSAH
jgi:transcriptional regulator with PAS, ATPase and Fis domain